MNKDRKKKRKEQRIKEKTYLKINIYDSRGRVIGSIMQGESVNYQRLLLKKAKGGEQYHRSQAMTSGIKTLKVR